MNPITAIDGYKVDHRRQYPEGTQVIYSNLTARKTRREYTDKMVFFGLQYFIEHYLIDEWNNGFFYRPKKTVIKEFKRRIDNYLGPNNVGTDHIEALHDLGYLPLDIMALPEGTVYPTRVPCMTIENTIPEFFWLTNYLETILSTTLWGMCTSATTAYAYKKLLREFAIRTGGDLNFVNWQAHDFSFRGMYGLEAAMMSGAAHLLSFTGTDTIPAIDFLEMYYGADSSMELIGGSVAATEHSVMCAGGEVNEVETFRRLIEDIYPSGVVSIVSDSWDFWKVMSEYTVTLKDKILARNGKVVFRPDSGDPVKIICGDLDRNVCEDSTLESWYANKGAIECLWDVFGGTINDKGYKELDHHVGLIYGDSITYDRAFEICARLMRKGFASTNVVFGVGSYTYQYVTRDTDGYAIKATYAEINGEPHEIFKRPKTDDGTKFSAKGRVAVFKKANGELCMHDQIKKPVLDFENQLKRVFLNGITGKKVTLQEIRDRINLNLAMELL